jgi:hypothetical protein
VDPKTGGPLRPPKPGYRYPGHLRDPVIDQVEECIEVEERATEPPPLPGHPEDMLYSDDEEDLEEDLEIDEQYSAYPYGDEEAMDVPEVLNSARGYGGEGDGYDSYDDAPSNAPRLGGSEPVRVSCRAVPARGSDHFNLIRPRPCGGHSAIFVPKDDSIHRDADKLVVFGGYRYDDGKQHIYHNYKTTVKRRMFVHYSNEVYWLDLSTSIWSRAFCVGDIPDGRHGHSATVVGHRYFCICVYMCVYLCGCLFLYAGLSLRGCMSICVCLWLCRKTKQI